MNARINLTADELRVIIFMHEFKRKGPKGNSRFTIRDILCSAVTQYHKNIKRMLGTHFI